VKDEANPPELRGRTPIVRARPVTIEDHLSRAYAARYRLDGAESEDWGHVCHRLAQSGFTRPGIEKRRDELRAVSLRCVVSATHADALDEALAGMPA
jgi:hypothetical protein